MNIKILGTGCSKCNSMEKITLKAIAELGIETKVEKVEDIQKIMEYGVMTTPALVIDEKVIVKGKVPSLKEIKKILTK